MENGRKKKSSDEKNREQGRRKMNLSTNGIYDERIIKRRTTCSAIFLSNEPVNPFSSAGYETNEIFRNDYHISALGYTIFDH
jgi:hypothetical protein